MLLEKAGGDIPTFSGRAEVSLDGLRQILEGQRVLGDELATHIELTLELGQGWLDKQHQIGDITQTTVDILLGQDVSTFEKDIRNSEQKGHEIMKNTSSNASTPAAAPKSSNAQTTVSDKAPQEIIEARIANLTLLTQARGAKSRLARLLDVSESIVSFLFSRSKEFTNSFTRKLESTVALPELWMDTVRDVYDLPHETWEKLGSSANLRGEGTSKKTRKNAAKGGNASAQKLDGAVAQGASTSAKTTVKGPNGQRVHQLPKKSDATAQQGAQQSAQPSASKPAAQQGTLSLQLRTSAAPSVLLDEPDYSVGQPELNLAQAGDTQQAGAPATDAQDEVSTGAASDQANAGAQAGSDSVAEAPAAAAPVPAAARSKPTATPKAAAKAPAAKHDAPAPTPAASPAAAAQPVATPAATAQQAAQPAVQPEASAPAAAPAAPAPASGMQLVALTPAQVSAEAANSRPDVLELSTLFLSPITEALLKTLAIKAKQGLFSEKDAYRLLGEIAEL